MDYENKNTVPQGGQDMCMDWNDSIEQDGREYVTLDEGDYNFTVVGFERGRHPGSAKIPACNKATITIDIENNGKSARCRFDLMLYRTMEWKISSFFRCIGQKKRGERLVMDWSAVLGSHGRAHIKPREYTTNSGEIKTANELDKFLDYDPAFFEGYQPVSVQKNDGWTEIDDSEELPF